MKYISAYKDNSGFHYIVEVKSTDGQVKQERFNYGPAPGLLYIEPAPAMEQAGSVPMPESEDEYQKRIEAEIESICVQLEQTGQVDPETGALTADVRIDLLKKSGK